MIYGKWGFELEGQASIKCSTFGDFLAQGTFKEDKLIEGSVRGFYRDMKNINVSFTGGKGKGSCKFGHSEYEGPFLLDNDKYGNFFMHGKGKLTNKETTTVSEGYFVFGKANGFFKVRVGEEVHFEEWEDHVFI